MSPINALGRAGSVLLLGGTSDIGRSIVGAIVSGPAARVILAGRDHDALAQAAAGISAETSVTQFDARDTAGHAAWVKSTFDDHGDIDVVVLAFGMLGDQERAESDSGHAVDLVDVNYRGAVSVALPIAQQLRRQGHGTLVVLSSVAGERARRSNFVYGSTKAALDAFAQGLNDSLDGSGARVMIVRPGFVHSKMTAGMEAAPMSVDPEAVAGAVATGLRRRSRIVWVPGKLRWVMSAVRHLPWVVFRRIKL